MDIIASPTGRTHIKSDFGMWPACRYDNLYGGRVVEYRKTNGKVTCRRCRQAYGLLVPGEREAIPGWEGGYKRRQPRRLTRPGH